MPWKRLAGAGLIGLGFVLFRPDWMNTIDAALSAVPIVVALAAWVLYYADENRPPVPFFETAAAFYGIAYGLNSFLIGFGFDPSLGWQGGFRFMDIRFPRPEDILDRTALTLTAIGSVLFMLGYYGSRRFLGSRVPSIRLPREYDDRFLILLLWALLLGNVLYFLVPEIRKLPSIGQFLQPVGYLALGAFYLLWRKGRIGSLHAAFIGVAILPFLLWLRFSSGALTPVIYIGLFAFFLLYFERERFPWKIALLSGLILLVAYPVLGVYRKAAWQQPPSIEGMLSNPKAYVDSVKNVYGERTLREGAVMSVATFVQRVGLSIYFSQVSRKSPSEVPYWNGETYKPIFSSFIPRAIWPDKPEERLGGVVGPRYGFVIDPERNKSSVNIPWLVEMYANFGSSGIIVGMGLNGVLFALLVALFVRRGMTFLESTVGLTVIFPLVYQQTNFTNMTGSLVPLVLALLLFFWGGLAWAPAIWCRAKESFLPILMRDIRKTGLIGSIVVGVLMIGFRPEWMPFSYAAYAVVPVFVSLMAWVLYLTDADRPRVPFFEVATSFYGVTYGLMVFLSGIFFELPYWKKTGFRFFDLTFPQPQDIFDPLALKLAAMGSVLFFLSYSGARTLMQKRIPSVAFLLPRVYDNRALIYLLWILFVLHLAYLLFPAMQRVPSVGQFLIPVGYLAIGAFFVLYTKGKLPLGHVLAVLFIGLPLEIWLRVSYGTATPIMFFFLILFLLTFLVASRVSWKAIFIGAFVSFLFLLLYYPSINTYRAMTWNKEQSIMTVLNNPTNLVRSFPEAFRGVRRHGEYVGVKFAAASLVRRLNIHILFSHVTRETPENVPYWGGETYKPVLTSIIPRAIWPEKPEDRLGAEVRKRYSVLSDEKNTSVINLPWMVEMYANFGRPGVTVGMILNGMLLAFLSHLFNRRRMTSLEVVVGLSAVFPLVYQESNFSNMFGSVPLLFASLWLYFYVGLNIFKSKRAVSLFGSG